MTDDGFVLVDRPRDGDVAVVTLNRPERMNSMAFDVMVPLRDRLRALGEDNSVRAIVLTGAGKGFCSGADQSGESGRMPGIAGLTPVSIALRAMEILDELILTLRRIHQPVIAAVNGAAIGGGLCLALACDVRLAAESAYFRAAGINNGLTASELGLSYLLPRSVGHSRAAEIMLTGRDVDSDEAATIGLVSRVVPDGTVLDAALDTAASITRWSRPGVELTKKTLWGSLDAASLEQHMQAEGHGQLLVRLLTKNFEEAVSARKEGRTPTFRD
ncbi:MAG: enoyl-CoA hydratase [Nocardioidaceae bacterium]|nr:enoyl-CoA hydratase [Nocardioidaceae bacterium]MCL2613212.1 enoyl-CoA hydratase [Nocardioidaceae bacterium]